MDRPDPPSLPNVVEALCAARSGPCRTGTGRRQELPSRDEVIRIVEDLRGVLFPGYFGTSELSPESLRFHVGSTLDRVLVSLGTQVKRGFCFTCDQDDPSRCPECDARARATVQELLSRLPEVRRLLGTDARAAYEGDPAARSEDEAVFCYPGMLALTSHRIAHVLEELGVPLIPRMIAEHAHSLTGIDIHPGAAIGESFFIDHGTGVVVGETARIGDRVRIYQGVTLGARSFPLDAGGRPVKGIPRHPIVEDDVIIYAGATILGRVTIGAGSVIGGNVWITRDVPAGSRVSQAVARQDAFGDGAGI
jgi:serine O-acetyltransferase